MFYLGFEKIAVSEKINPNRLAKTLMARAGLDHRIAKLLHKDLTKQLAYAQGYKGRSKRAVLRAISSEYPNPKLLSKKVAPRIKEMSRQSLLSQKPTSEDSYLKKFKEWRLKQEGKLPGWDY